MAATCANSPPVKKFWQGDYAHDGEHWSFPVSTNVPKPVQQDGPPIWIAARDPDTHKFAVSNGFNVMVAPLPKDDEEVADLARKFDAAVNANPGVSRPKLMCLRHTFIHAKEDTEGWQPAAEAISTLYRTFSSWAFGKQPPVRRRLSSRARHTPHWSWTAMKRSRGRSSAPPRSLVGICTPLSPG